MRIATATSALSGVLMPPRIVRESEITYTEKAVTFDSDRNRRKQERQMNNPTYNAHGTTVEEKLESDEQAIVEQVVASPIDVIA
jgi:hypothetical protein